MVAARSKIVNVPFCIYIYFLNGYKTVVEYNKRIVVSALRTAVSRLASGKLLCDDAA
jgi:hypothetical protein